MIILDWIPIGLAAKKMRVDKNKLYDKAQYVEGMMKSFGPRHYYKKCMFNEVMGGMSWEEMALKYPTRPGLKFAVSKVRERLGEKWRRTR